jgi:copper oxidase (laccase) domain-containing protein
MNAFVAISQAIDGNMYIPEEQDNADVVRTRSIWLAKQGIELANTTRVYITYDQGDFCRYRIVDESNKGEGMNAGDSETADALVTTTPNHALFLPVADCVATTLFDPEHGVLMVSHLGRHSLEQHGAEQSVAFLSEQFKTRPEALKVWLSPAPNKEMYPIHALDNKGMKETALEQLEDAGVLRVNIIDAPEDTATDNRYFSHSEFLKGNKLTDGRFAMVAMMSE